MKPRFLYFTILFFAAIALFAISGDRLTLRLVGASALLALGAASIALPIGAALAISLARLPLTGRWLAQALLTLLLFQPLYLTCGAWRAAFGPQGWLHDLIGPAANPFLLDGWFGAILLHAVAAIPATFFFVRLQLAACAPELEEDALLNSSTFSTLFNVTLRRALPGVLIAAVWIGVVSFGEMTVTSICNVRTYAEVLFTGITLGEAVDQTSLPIWPAAFVTLGLTLIATALAARLAPGQTSEMPSRAMIFPLTRRRRTLATASVWLVVLLLFGIPIGALLYKAGLIVEVTDGQVVRYWSTAKLGELIARAFERHLGLFQWTFALGAVVAAATASISVCVAWYALRLRYGRYLIATLSGVLFGIPGPIIALSLIWLLNRRQSPALIYLYDHTIFAPAIALIVISLPICLLLTWHLFRADAGDLDEAAQLEGYGWWKRMWRVGVTRRPAALVAIFLLAFALATNDVTASYLVTPPGVDTLSRTIFEMLHYGAEDNVASLCLINLAFSSALGIITIMLLRPAIRAAES
ncbi:MAG: ABC transporter permease [Blastopirellula sp. JB062]